MVQLNLIYLIFYSLVLLENLTFTMPMETRSQARSANLNTMSSNSPSASKSARRGHCTSTVSADQNSLFWRWANDAEAIANQTTNQTPTCHPTGWRPIIHYMQIGGQCGQSCPCCRAKVYKLGIDSDAKFGACSVCLNSPHPYFDPSS